MTRTAILVTLLITALATMLSALPAQAQTRVFVSGTGNDGNPCTFAQPCRTFAQAFTTVTAVTTSGGEIDVLDPAGYGPLTITHGISIQAHGFAGITQATSMATAITISAGASDAITLNGLLIDGAGTGGYGIVIYTAGSVQILNCVIRFFVNHGIILYTTNTPVNLLVSDTVASDSEVGIYISQMSGASTNTPVTLERISVNNNYAAGVFVDSGPVMIANSVMSNNSIGLESDSGITWLAHSAISGNGEFHGSGVYVGVGGTVNSYGNNHINGNTTNVIGTLTPVSSE